MIISRFLPSLSSRSQALARSSGTVSEVNPFMNTISRDNQTQPARRSAGQAGFSLLEVVLAVALGIIILGGVTIGYTYGKRAMVVNNQRTEVQTFKTFIEDARSAKAAAGTTSYGPDLTGDQMCGVLQKIPSMLTDPYTGNLRAGPSANCAGTDAGVYATTDPPPTPVSTTGNYTNAADLGLT